MIFQIIKQSKDKNRNTKEIGPCGHFRKMREELFLVLEFLVAWIFWKHYNACVFYEVFPNISKLFLDIKGEASL